MWWLTYFCEILVISVLCVWDRANWLLHCTFPWLFSSQDKSPRTGPCFPLQRTASLGFVAQTGECCLAKGATRPFLLWTHVSCCSLTLELWALSNHIWLVCLSVRGSLTLELTLFFFTVACMQNRP